MQHVLIALFEVIHLLPHLNHLLQNFLAESYFMLWWMWCSPKGIDCELNNCKREGQAYTEKISFATSFSVSIAFSVLSKPSLMGSSL